MLKMVLGHELGHIRYNHVKWWYNLLVFVGNLPGANFLLGNPFSRSHEYSANQLGAALADDTTGEGLMILAAGKHAYKDINLEEYEQHQFRGGFWVTLSNAFSDQPITAWRIGAIKQKRHDGIFFSTLQKEKSQ